MELCKDHVVTDESLGFSVARTRDAEWDAVERVDWQIVNQGSHMFHGVARLHVDLPVPFRSPWFLVPGFLYGENRRIGMGAREGKYPRYDPTVKVPRRMASSGWGFAAD
ncbi:MAG: hypothetical protein HQ523_07175 [Lentisphaerae bacterium]|nr:hypothetical protein [Lentisphaerota bacterium]